MKTEHETGKLYLIPFFETDEDAQRFYTDGVIQACAKSFKPVLNSLVSFEDFQVKFAFVRPQEPISGSEPTKP